jgi:integrase
MRKTLTSRFVESKAAIPPAGRVDWPDTVVPGLMLRASANGHRAYVLVARFPLHPKNPTRRTLGSVGMLSLEQAREKARDWLRLIDRGTDPKVEEIRARAAALRAQANSFAAVWDAFWHAHGSKLAKARECQRAGTAFVRLWGARPAAEIEPAEVAAYFRDLGRKAPGEARNRLGHLRRMYSWAIGSGGFGLAINPCSVLKPADLVGAKVMRDRILTDDEIRAVWGACDALGYPYGPFVRLLLLTGQRVSEVAGMSWGELDLVERAVWTIPACRMKADRAHVIPLAADTLTLLRSLPRFAGPYVLTTTDGRKPINSAAKAKAKLDALTGITGWVLHDLRRTMRSGLSALPIEDRVREQMVAHAQPGLHAVYNLYDYLDEKRRGFELWEARLRGILSPKPPAEVASLRAERERRAAVA